MTLPNTAGTSSTNDRDQRTALHTFFAPSEEEVPIGWECADPALQIDGWQCDSATQPLQSLY